MSEELYYLERAYSVASEDRLQTPSWKWKVVVTTTDLDYLRRIKQGNERIIDCDGVVLVGPSVVAYQS